MSELIRADELITNFRVRLGEPREGTFRTIRYDGINKDLDVLLSILNQAQRHVTWMCYSANAALLEDTFYLEVISGVSRYTLPERTLSLVSVFHRTYGQEYEVERANLFEIRRTTRSLRSDYRYRFYEVREQVPIISARGIISTDNPNRIEATGLAAVRVNDSFYNLTDDSQGIVKATFPALNAITIEPLEGGKRNTLKKGDVFQIDMAEKTRDSIDFWPMLSKEDSTVGFKGNPTDWRLNEDNVMFRVDAHIASIPTGFEQDERLVLNVLNSDDEVVAEGAKEGLVVGYNEFYFPEFVQLEEDTDYTVQVIRADNENELNVTEIELWVRENPESVECRRARLPREMEKRTDYCEMPVWSHEAVFAYAHIIAQKMMSRNPNADRGLLNEFMTAIEDVKAFKFKQDERGPHSMAMIGGNRSSNWPYPSHYGTAGPSPFELL